MPLPLIPLFPLKMGKNAENPALLKKCLKIIGRKLIISSSNKMKPPLKPSKKTQAIRAGPA